MAEFIRRRRFMQQLKLPKLSKKNIAEFFDGKPKKKKPGKQVEVTRKVREFASRFEVKKPEDVSKIMDAISKIKSALVPFHSLKKIYGKRTAHDILVSNKIATLHTRDKKHDDYPVAGCHDYALVLAAVLRAKGFEIVFVRTKAHSRVKFKFNDVWYAADYRIGRTKSSARVYPVTIEHTGHDNLLKKRKQYAEGKDGWDLGIKGVRNFHRYNRRRKKLVREKGNLYIRTRNE